MLNNPSRYNPSVYPIHSSLAAKDNNFDRIMEVFLRKAEMGGQAGKERLALIINLQANDGKTAMHVYSRTYGDNLQNLAMADLLLMHGADLNIRDTEGKTALHDAVEAVAKGAELKNTMIYMGWLIKNGCNPNIANSYGVKPIDQLQSITRNDKLNDKMLVNEYNKFEAQEYRKVNAAIARAEKSVTEYKNGLNELNETLEKIKSNSDNKPSNTPLSMRSGLPQNSTSVKISPENSPKLPKHVFDDKERRGKQKEQSKKGCSLM
jgi:hypothetical protein